MDLQTSVHENFQTFILRSRHTVIACVPIFIAIVLRQIVILQRTFMKNEQDKHSVILHFYISKYIIYATDKDKRSLFKT